MHTQRPIFNLLCLPQQGQIAIPFTFLKSFLFKLIILIALSYISIEGKAQIAVLDTIIIDSTSINIYYTSTAPKKIYVDIRYRLKETDNWKSIDHNTSNPIEGDKGIVAIWGRTTKKSIKWTINDPYVFEEGQLDIKLISGIYIEGGSFTIGQPNPNLGGKGMSKNEQPPTQRQVKAFIINPFEVTNQEFCLFLNAHKDKDISKWYKVDSKGGFILRNKDRYIPKNEDRNKPVNHVTWHGAKAYCEWIGARLPTETEWEYIATNRGECDASFYPGCYRYYNKMIYPEIRDVGTGISTDSTDVYNMADNISEWVEDCFQSYDKKPSYDNCPRKVIRGGNNTATNRFEHYYRTGVRRLSSPNSADTTTGFRIAWSLN